MKVGRQSLVIALLLAAISTARAGTPVKDRSEHLRLLRAQASEQKNLGPLDRAYLDGLAILEQPNRCSDFFGGEAAEAVLTELVVRLQETRFTNSDIGVRMSGRFEMFGGSDHYLSYRLFADAALNTEGPFFKAKVFAADPVVPSVGSFHPKTRSARVLILFHELAHLIQGRDGAWLIPDDGNRPDLSHENSRTIEARCGEQIRAL